MSMPPHWVHDWLTADRFAKYLKRAGGDPDRALALYEWNAELASAFLHDLGHLEIGLRNAYDRVLLGHPDLHGQDWLDPAGRITVFAPHVVTDENGQGVDKNATPRGQIKSACKHSGYGAGAVPRGKAVAELMFGFWTYLTDDLHEKTLWVPVLHKAYIPGADRKKLHAALTALRELRNRVAHHESVFDQAPESHRRHVIFVARHLSPNLRDYIRNASSLPALIAKRP